jgi:hypothetical protein
MTNEASQKLALLAEKMEGHVTHGKTVEDHIKWVVKAATDVGLNSEEGIIVFASSDAKGSYNVQFNGYSSFWPAWAYEIALSAVSNKNMVVVISDGDPFGDNLLQIFVFSQNA